MNAFREQYQDAERELLDMAAHIDELVVQSRRTEALLAELQFRSQARTQRAMIWEACECRDCRLLRTVARDMQLRAQARTRRAMILEAGVSVRPFPNRGRVIVYDEPRPIWFTRGRLASHYSLPLIYVLCRLVKNIVMDTAITSWDGHRILMGWFRPSGELSRADGGRALAALGYVTITWLAVWAVIYSVLMVVF